LVARRLARRLAHLRAIHAALVARAQAIAASRSWTAIAM